MTLEEVKEKATNIIYTLNEQIADNDDLGFNREELESMQEEIDVIKELLKALEEYEDYLDTEIH